jgi:hypothetical protein
MSVNELSAMVGAVVSRIEGDASSDRLVFHAEDGRAFSFYHSQDCCENVTIEDIAGDLSDLVGSPILMAEEVSNEPEPGFEEECVPESYTWTFYKFATIKGSVTVRWLGTSNGYYSESVTFEVEPPPRCQVHEDCRESEALGRACLLAGQPSSNPPEPKR